MMNFTANGISIKVINKHPLPFIELKCGVALAFFQTSIVGFGMPVALKT